MNKYYQFFEILRKKPPVKMGGTWLITRYEDIDKVLSNPSLFSSNRTELLFQGLEEDLKTKMVKNHLTAWILHKDENTMNAKRSIVKQLMQYSRHKLQVFLLDQIRSILRNLEGKKKYDFRKEVAIPLSCRIMMDYLEIPVIDTKIQEEKIFYHMQNIANKIAFLRYNQNDVNSLSKSLLYVAKLGKDYNGIDDDFSDSEYVTYDVSLERMQRGLIFHAFVHDLTNVICNVYIVLKSNSYEYNDNTIGFAIDEAIRLEPPVQAVVRTATADASISMQKIKKDEHLTLFLSSGNRDSTVLGLENSNDFKLNRDCKLFNFGWGLHSCVAQSFVKKILSEIISSELYSQKNTISSLSWDDESRTYRNVDQLQVDLVEC